MEREPPVVLVKTWYQLCQKADDSATRDHAKRMLLGAFGTEQGIQAFLKKHNIKNR
tara:strand:- start:275 stop:442 length:168 start_codon:yes stop_codon:yes gene_type:complete